MRMTVERVQAGDPAAEEELVRELRRRVFVVLMARMGDAEAAKELTQDVLMAVLDAIRKNRIDNPERVAAFAHGVARNLANNHIRMRAQAPTLVELTDASAWADAEEEAVMAERRQMVRMAIAELDETDRRVVTLSIVEGCSAPEVSARLGLSPDAVRARKSRALKRLTERLQKGMSQWRPFPLLRK
jgi:RNA polymerase sigma factor (sigma-70 family)